MGSNWMLESRDIIFTVTSLVDSPVTELIRTFAFTHSEKIHSFSIVISFYVCRIFIFSGVILSIEQPRKYEWKSQICGLYKNVNNSS